MSSNLLPLFSCIKTFSFVIGTATLLVGCGVGESKQPTTITIDGSSTVYPITEAIIKNYKSESDAEVDVTVNFSGTGGGFRKFCSGETDINNASRPILTEEIKLCKENKISYFELPIGFDALTIVVNPQNTWAKDITVAELKKIWEPEAQQNIKTWNQIRASWPNKPLNLYGPDIDSGTYDYFTAAIVGKEKSSRTDYQASKDDELIEQAIINDPNGLAYFGYAYYQKKLDTLKALAVDNQKGNGAIMPSQNPEDIERYRPLSRPLFIYVNADVARNNPAFTNFVDFYMRKASQVVEEVGYIPFQSDDYTKLYRNFHKTKVGTVFEGKSEFDLTLDEVLKKRAEY